MTNRLIEDAGERVHLYHGALWAFTACSAIAAMVAFYLRVTGRIGVAGAIGIVLLGWVVAAAIVVLVWKVSGTASTVLIHTLTGAGNLAPAPSFSREESLIARGRFEEAADCFAAHLAAHPADLHARLALAALWRDQLRQPARAEQMLLETRRLNAPPGIEFAVANALIDLYRATGQVGREMSELARFADRFAGTPAAAQARAALGRLKAER